MTFDFANMAGEETVDWEQFLVDTDLGENIHAFPQVASPVSDAQTATPKSTESEQSQALDPTDRDHDDQDFFTFTMPDVGIMHTADDIFAPLPAYDAPISFPDPHGTADPTMTSTFGFGFGDFNSLTGLGDDAAIQLGLTGLLEKLAAPVAPVEPAVDINVTLQQAYAALGWSPTGPALTAIEPSQLISPRPLLKRRNSDSSAESAPIKRPRGRPPKSRSPTDTPQLPAKRPYNRRQPKGGHSVSALAARLTTASPLSRCISIGADDSDGEDGTPAPGRCTSSGKLSTARPKSVVPEKYLKDGSAQTILGMTVDAISSYPTFEELLRHVSLELQKGAAEFGARISDNRDKAKDAAKKSRDEKRARIDTLEAKVEDLEGVIDGMQVVMRGLVSRGLLSQQEVARWV